MTYFTRIASATLGVAAMSLTLAGCGSTAAPRPVTPSAAASSTAAAAATQLETARAAAREVLTAWSRRDLPYAQWWAQLAPLMSPQGQQDYAYSDPALIPVLELDSAPAKVTLDGALATVKVPSSIGTLTVHLQQRYASREWLASRIDFPQTRAHGGRR